MYIWTKGAEASLYKRLIVEEFFFSPYNFDYLCFLLYHADLPV